MAFLIILMTFHGPALFFFTQVWGSELSLGLLPHLTEKISSPEIIPKVYFALSTCIASVLLGMRIFSILGQKPKTYISRLNSHSKIYSIKRTILITQLSALFIGIFLLTQYAFIASPTELFRYYFSNIDEFEKVGIRRTSTLPFYPYQVLLTAFFPFLSFVLLAQAQLEKITGAEKTKIRQYAVGFTALVMLAKLSQYNKAGPVIFSLQILFVLTYARTLSFRIHFWHLKIFLLGIFSIITITALVNSTGNWTLTLFSAFERTFMIPNEVIFEYFASIPEHLPHGFGTGISWISAFTSENANEALGTYWKVGAIVRGDYGSTSNSFFIADAWAEFSWFGIVALSLLAGWIVRWHDYQVASWGTSPVAIALLVSGYYGAYTLGTTALTTAMLTGGLVLTPILARTLQSKKY